MIFLFFILINGFLSPSFANVIIKADIYKNANYIEYDSEKLTLEMGKKISLLREKKMDPNDDHFKGEPPTLPEIEKYNREGSKRSVEIRNVLKMSGPVLYSDETKDCYLAFIPKQTDDIPSLTIVPGITFESMGKATHSYHDWQVANEVYSTYYRNFIAKKNGVEVGRAQLRCGFKRDLKKVGEKNIKEDLQNIYINTLKDLDLIHQGTSVGIGSKIVNKASGIFSKEPPKKYPTPGASK